MQIRPLTASDSDSARELFASHRYMGTSLANSVIAVTESGALDPAQARDPDQQNQILYNRFADTYLTGLKSFQALGLFDDQRLKTFIAYYQPPDDASWYYTLCHSQGTIDSHRQLLDRVLAINEAQGRLKFYTLINARYVNVVRRWGWSKYNAERYGYFDEFFVPAKCRCFYSAPWDLLYKKALLPNPTVVRCTFLKQQYRDPLPMGGGL